ncbi:hypothetical protein GCM10010166_23340 [Couchioplanes caeruleus subsp. azureus]|nr:hypothetical protein GCM10010166_23340 [Couchioplanes caeruleus subsp. azureus]
MAVPLAPWRSAPPMISNRAATTYLLRMPLPAAGTGGKPGGAAVRRPARNAGRARRERLAYEVKRNKTETSG